MMLKNMFNAARGPLIVLAALVMTAPFIVYGGTIALFLFAGWEQQQKRERELARDIYGATYADAEKVALRDETTSIQPLNQPFVLTVALSAPATSPPLAQPDRDVRLRAARLGEDECRAFVKTLAARCRVLSSDGGSKSVLLKLELEQKAPPPAPGRPASGERDVLQVDYVDVRPGDTSAGRWALYAGIAEDCRQQEATFGSCTLLHVTARSRTHPSRNGGLATRTDISVVIAVRRNFDVAALMKERRRGL